MLALIIITFGILSRIIVHTPNFSPVLSLAFLSGMYLKGRQPVLVPLALMVLSDLITGFYGAEMFFVWGSIVLTSLIGLSLKEKKNFGTVFTGSILSAAVFFLITNFGSWLTLYPHSMAGLGQCYFLAIPFFRSTLVSTIAYSLVFYAAYEWILKRSQGTALVRFV